MQGEIFLLVLLVLGRSTTTRAFAVLDQRQYNTYTHNNEWRTARFASKNAVTEDRRKALMARQGPYFRLERGSGEIEFGATAKLVTQLDTEPAKDIVYAWLEQERDLAMSIWDPKLIQQREDTIYRLQIMTLQFVTLQLAPWVDVRMKTYTARSVKDPSVTMPIFRLQSMDFEPNLQVLPGMRVTAESLGIKIQVVGEMRPTENGVTGSISFATIGELPPPLRILPEDALKSASDKINETIVQFAIKSFEAGAKENYLEFKKRYRKERNALAVEAVEEKRT